MYQLFQVLWKTKMNYWLEDNSLSPDYESQACGALAQSQLVFDISPYYSCIGKVWPMPSEINYLTLSEISTCHPSIWLYCGCLYPILLDQKIFQIQICSSINSFYQTIFGLQKICAQSFCRTKKLGPKNLFINPKILLET